MNSFAIESRLYHAPRLQADAFREVNESAIHEGDAGREHLFVFRNEGLDLSYAQMVHPSDFVAVQIQVTEGRPALVSATLFPEERVWTDHRATLGWTPAPPRVDDILVARHRAAPPLSPRARYELLIATGRRGEPVGEAGVLFTSAFTTSAFESFGDLVASCVGPIASVTALARPDRRCS